MWTSLSRIPKPPLYPSLPQKAGSRRGMCSTAGFKAHRNPASFCIMQQNRIWKLYTKWISFLKNHKLPLSLKMLTEMLLNKPYKWASPLAWNASSASLPASPPFTHAHTHTHTYTPSLGGVFSALLITSSCKASKTLHTEFKTHLVLSLSLQLFSQMLAEPAFVSRLEQCLGTRFWSQSSLD